MFFVFTSMPYLGCLLFVFFSHHSWPTLFSTMSAWTEINLNSKAALIFSLKHPASKKKLKLQNIPVTDALCIRSKSSSRRTKIMFKNILKLLTQEKLDVPQIWFSEEFATNHLRWTNFKYSLLQMMILSIVFGVHSTCNKVAIFFLQILTKTFYPNRINIFAK